MKYVAIIYLAWLCLGVMAFIGLLYYAHLKLKKMGYKGLVDFMRNP